VWYHRTLRAKPHFTFVGIAAEPASVRRLGFASYCAHHSYAFQIQGLSPTKIGWDSYLSEQSRLQLVDGALHQKLSSFDSAFRSSHQRRLTLEDFVQHFNGGKALDNRDGRWIFVDPVTGGRAAIEQFPDQTVAIIEPGYGLLSFSRPAQPNLTVLVLSFAAGVISCFLLLASYVSLSTDWSRLGRSERVCGAWRLVALALITIQFSWLGSKFFPSWQPFGDAQILGYQIIFASPSLVFLLGAYMGGKPKDQTPRCHWCRYDLTGNRSGTCPECGEPIVGTAVL